LSLESEVGYGLAYVAVIENDLPDREPQAKEIVAVAGRAVADLRARSRMPAQDLRELVEEEGDALRELGRRRQGGRPRGDFHAAPGDDLRVVFGDEFVQHGDAPDFGLSMGQPRGKV